MPQQSPRPSSGLTGPLILLGTSVLCWCLASTLSPWLIYERTLLADGEVWRLFSAHLLHANVYHLLINSAGLALLWLLHGQHYTTASFLSYSLIVGLLCSAGLYLWSPEIQQYVGLSGVLHGLIIWGGYRDIRRGQYTGYLLLAGTWIKVLFEQVTGGSAGTAELIGIEVAVDAHLLGAVAGSLLSLLLWIRDSFGNLGRTAAGA